VKKIRLYKNRNGVFVIEKDGIKEYYLTLESFLEDVEALSKDGYLEISNDIWKLFRHVVKN
jgi:hypothetical protein